MTEGSARPIMQVRPTWGRVKAARIELARRQSERGAESLREFMKIAWHRVEPETPYLSNWHLDCISDYLQAVHDGHITDLIINIPPRHGKSLTVCVFWPTWEWISKPGLRYLFSSFSGSNTVRDTVYSRRLIQSAWFQERWGYAFRLSRDVNRQARMENTVGGFRMAHGVKAGVTGEGGQRIVVDDPHQLDDDMKPSALFDVGEWWDGVMSTRVNNPKTAARVIVQQRIHDKDLSGHLIDAMEDGGRHFEKLILPAEYERQHHANFRATSKKTGGLWVPRVEARHLPEHALLKREEETGVVYEPNDLVPIDGDPRMDERELLWPERMPRDELDLMKKQLHRKANGQLQQRPVPSDGDVFKERFFRYWTYSPGTNNEYGVLHLDHEDRLIELDGFIFSTVDLATSLAATANETVISTWMWKEPYLLWLHCDHDKYEGPDIVPAINRNRVRWNAQLVGIEKSGVQLSFVQEARRRGMPVVPLRPDRDKRSRSIPAAVLMDGQQLLLPRTETSKDWLPLAEAQLLKFTGSPNDEDDIVDTVSYGAWIVLNYLDRTDRGRKRTWGREARELGPQIEEPEVV